MAAVWEAKARGQPTQGLSEPPSETLLQEIFWKKGLEVQFSGSVS